MLAQRKIEHHVLECFRSKQILAAKERGARMQAEAALVSEEKRRMGRDADELRRLLREAILVGSIYFRGNDRIRMKAASTSDEWPRQLWRGRSPGRSRLPGTGATS